MPGRATSYVIDDGVVYMTHLARGGCVGYVEGITVALRDSRVGAWYVDRGRVGVCGMGRASAYVVPRPAPMQGPCLRHGVPPSSAHTLPAWASGPIPATHPEHQSGTTPPPPPLGV